MNLDIKKVATKPVAPYAANTLYFVEAAGGVYVDTYITSMDGVSLLKFVLHSDVVAAIAAAGGGGGTVETTTNVAITYNGDDSVNTVTETVNELPRVTTYGYTNGVVTTETITYNGVTTTATYTYVSDLLTNVAYVVS